MTAPKWYDWTIPQEKATQDMVCNVLEVACDRFVIGVETGEGGYKHYQCRGVLKKGLDWDAMKQLYGPMGWHVTPTSQEGRNWRYVQKEGNYYCSWEKAISKYALLDLLPWQKQAIMMMDEQGERRISVIVDERGNHGKTYLAKYCVASHRAEYVPPFTDALDYMAYAMAKPSRAYIFDVPRSETIKQKKGMWSAIEQIKNGYLYDKRYNFKDMWIEPPQVLVFANEEPPLEALSSDRWQICDFMQMGKVDVLTPRVKGEDY